MSNMNYAEISTQKLNKLIENSTFYYDFINSPLEIIIDRLKAGLKFPNYKYDFIARMLKINDIDISRYVIMLLEKNNYLLSRMLNEKCKEKYFKEVFKEPSSIGSLEIVINLFFEEFSYNVIKNIRIMFNFLMQIDEKVIPLDRMNIYKQILNYTNLKPKDQIKLLKQLSMQERLSSVFYDDVRNCKNLSYSLIRDKVISYDEIKPLLSISLSLKYNHDVFELKGEPFYLLITTTHRNRKARQYTQFTTEAKTSSYSLISDENIGTYLSLEENIILGFASFNINNVMLVFESDAYTNHECGSKIMPPFYTPESLMMNTINYNEILYKNEEYDEKSAGYVKRPLQPSYVICYDSIYEGDLMAAKLHNIPIILLHSKCYKSKEGNENVLSDDDKSFLDRKDTVQFYLSAESKAKVLSIK